MANASWIFSTLIIIVACILVSFHFKSFRPIECVIQTHTVIDYLMWLTMIGPVSSVHLQKLKLTSEGKSAHITHWYQD